MPISKIEKLENKVQHGQNAVYNFYKEKVKNLGPRFQVKQILFSEIMMDFNKTWMRENIIGKGMIFRLPYNLGDIVCKKRKKLLILDKNGNVVTRYLPVDWKKTRDKWREMYSDKTDKEIFAIKGKPLYYLFNEHTSGYGYSIFWDRNHSRIPNKTVYCFVPNRANHRYLAKFLKEGIDIPDYYDVLPKRRNRRWWKQKK